MDEEHCVPLNSLIVVLNKIADFVDVDTKDHSRATQQIAVQIGGRMGWDGVDLLHLGYGADIHDIGKIAISPVVFRQPSKLTRAQYASVRQHPLFGAEMIQYAGLPQIIGDCVKYHHEHFDGSGYPEGLAGEKIPMCARIVCVADVWESIRSDRPYRLAMSFDKAVEVMHEYSRWFDPGVFSAFLKTI